MANPSLALIKQNLLKGLPLSQADLAFVVEKLISTWQLEGDQEITNDFSVTVPSTNPTLDSITTLELRERVLRTGITLDDGFTGLSVDHEGSLGIGGSVEINGGTGGIAVTTSGASITLAGSSINLNPTGSIFANLGNGGTFSLALPNANTAIETKITTVSSEPVTTTYWQNRRTTTDATVSTLHTVPIPASTTVFLHGFITARRTGGGSGTAEDGAAYEFKVAYKNVAGTATIIGTATITAIAESQVGWDVTLVPTASNVAIRVTGAASNNISWHLSELKVMTVSA